ncbi:hypothetical protein [Azospirillum sp. ST 5-10]|uniref:hypothetical protein n=1 Tax=unclassified Azospirillum TaxID=2630922 RepID=UPI003F4A5280
MTGVQFALLLMTGAAVATGVALHRQGALGTAGLVLATLAALAIAGVLYVSQS